MKCVVQFAVAVAILGFTLASDDPVYNVTSGAEDYTLLVGRSMQAKLELAALKLATVKLRHADRMQSVENHQHMVMQEMLQFDSSLVQHQALTLSRKHCVQKYKPFVPKVREVEQNFTKCIHSADASASRFTQDAEMHLSSATQIREEEVPRIYSNCKSFCLHDSKVADCVSETVDTKLLEFNCHMNKFEIGLQESLYSSTIIAAEATRCSFAVQKRVLASNGGALSLCDVCNEEFQAQDRPLNDRHIAERKLMERLRLGRGSLDEFV